MSDSDPALIANSNTVRSLRDRERKREQGWGWISASLAALAGWGVIALLGWPANPGLLLGSLGTGIYMVVRYR